VRDPFGFGLSPLELLSTNPFTLMRRMSEEMDRTFGQFFGESRTGAGSWYPAIEVAERDNQLQVHAELPGLDPEDVKVEITDDALVIRGERKSQREHQIGGAYRSERRYGQFYREIPLPQGVNADQAKAQFRNGVLEIAVPLPQQVSSRREIPISTGEATGTSTGSSSGTSNASGQTSVQAGSSGSNSSIGTGTQATAAKAST
jgi:HSP20 family protein